jgi:flagellar biosynthetic protein FliP
MFDSLPPFDQHPATSMAALGLRPAKPRRPSWVTWFVLLGLGLALAGVAQAAPLSPIDWANSKANSEEMSSALRIFLSLTALSFLPAALICMTCFVRIAVVLSMLRHAIGLMETPPNMVIIVLSLFLTLFAMQPTLQRLQTEAVQPYLAGQLTTQDAAQAGTRPLKEFMVRQTRERDLKTMLDAAGAKAPQSMEDISLVHLIPAFMLSELRAAFQIGFIVFLPFLLIDLIVASVLMALGMMMVPPATVSVPLKLLLFVLIDGWNLLTVALLGSIH